MIYLLSQVEDVSKIPEDITEKHTKHNFMFKFKKEIKVCSAFNWVQKGGTKFNSRKNFTGSFSWSS